MTSFRVRAVTRLTDAGFLGVDEVQLEAPGGEELRRVVVRHPGAAVVVPVETDGTTAILVRQYRAAVGHEVLEVPAGKRDVEGEPPHDTAARELEEEIGRRPGRLVKLAEFFNTPGFCDEYTHIYLALDLETVAQATPHSAEERAMTVEHVALAEVEALVAARTLVDAKSIIGLLLARQYLAGAHTGVPD